MARKIPPILLCLLLGTAIASAQTWIDPAGIPGALLLCGADQPSAAVLENFVELAGGGKAKLAIVVADKAKGDSLQCKSIIEAAKNQNAAAPVVVAYDDAPEALRGATGVWLHVDSATAWAKALKKKSLAAECRAVLKSGGVIAAAGQGVRYLGTKEFAAKDPLCLNLLPDSIITPSGKLTGRTPENGVPSPWQGLVRYDIQDDATLLVHGRTLRVLGANAVCIYLTAPSSSLEIQLRAKGVQDLTALRRAARDRAQGFPPKMPEPPIVAKGTLVIVGGGGAPAGLTKKFVGYAGGAGKACIVIFPTASPDPLPKRETQAAAFKKAGAKKATVLYGRTRKEVESKEFLDTLKEATGLWFDGGRQWRFVDCYENTKALPAMFDVLQRGGVIGGSSAGATIQGDYLCRGGVFNNFDIRYEGYERGLGFLKGVAIDQHFTQRKRQADMTKLMKIYPQYLGIGIDEATAIVVKGQVAEIIGKGKVHFYDSKRKIEKGRPDFVAISAGARYDLKERKIVTPTP